MHHGRPWGQTPAPGVAMSATLGHLSLTSRRIRPLPTVRGTQGYPGYKPTQTPDAGPGLCGAVLCDAPAAPAARTGTSPAVRGFKRWVSWGTPPAARPWEAGGGTLCGHPRSSRAPLPRGRTPSHTLGRRRRTFCPRPDRRERCLSPRISSQHASRAFLPEFGSGEEPSLGALSTGHPHRTAGLLRPRRTESA